MEYFLLVDGKKQGPFDMIAMIKKIKNGNLNADSMVARAIDGEYIKATEIQEVANLLEEHANPDVTVRAVNVQMTLKVSVQEGIELWVRRVLDYTLIAGVFLAVGFGVKALFKTILPIGSVLSSYFGCMVVMSLFCVFCYYVLETKRSQSVDFKDFFRATKRNYLGFLLLSMPLSLFIMLYSVSMEFGLLASFVTLLVITLLVFVPFLAMDGGMGVLNAAKLSVKKVLSLGGDNFGVILAIISINLFTAILPSLIKPELLGLGLFISIPITISALAYIYDQIFV